MNKLMAERWLSNTTMNTWQNKSKTYIYNYRRLKSMYMKKSVVLKEDENMLTNILKST